MRSTLPLLQVMVLRPDLYLLDHRCVRINCYVDECSRIIVIKLSWNREILEETICDDFRIDLPPLIQDIIDMKRYSPCQGFSDQSPDDGLFDVFRRLRKNDIQFILLEKYNGGIIYRSRNCKFVIDSLEMVREENDQNYKSIFHNRCKHCQEFYTDIDVKYSHGRFTRPKQQCNGNVIDPNDSCEQTVTHRIDVESENHSLTDRTILKENSDINRTREEKRLSRQCSSRYKKTKYKDFVVEMKEESPDMVQSESEVSSPEKRNGENNENFVPHAQDQEVRR